MGLRMNSNLTYKMGEDCLFSMVATIIGNFTLLLGFGVLVSPLLVTELSRPRDSLWGSVFLLLGLTLITSHDLFNGSLMLVLVSGSLLVLRLGYEVIQSRWQRLSEEEQMRLGTLERWTTGVDQFLKTFVRLGGSFLEFHQKIWPKPTVPKKKWIRPEKKEELTSQDQSIAQSTVNSKNSKDDSQQQPQKTLERHDLQEDS